jgi:hypothetical protein
MPSAASSLERRAMIGETPYRAITYSSVLSLALGIASILAFAHLICEVFAVASVLFGVLAIRRVNAAPQEWAGKSLACAGIVLSLLFGGGAAAVNIATTIERHQMGRATADRFVDKLSKGEMEAAFWLTLPQAFRKSLSHTNDIEDLPPEMANLKERYMEFRQENEALTDMITTGRTTIEFEMVEGTGEFRGQDFAVLVYLVHSRDGDTRLMLNVGSARDPEKSGKSWFVRETHLGYVPHSFQSGATGHDHAH